MSLPNDTARVAAAIRCLLDVRQGDGGWAEVVWRSEGRRSYSFASTLLPTTNAGTCSGRTLPSTSPYANQRGDLVLKCYNDAGKNTVADWLNWRDLVIEPRDEVAPATK